MFNLWMDRTISVSAARSVLPEIVQRVTEGEEITLTRHGEPVAVLVRPDSLRLRRAAAALEGAADVRELLVAAKDTPLDAVPGISMERAEVMLSELRADRSRR
jgi:prevent-host-death family protein